MGSDSRSDSRWSDLCVPEMPGRAYYCEAIGLFGNRKVSVLQFLGGYSLCFIKFSHFSLQNSWGGVERKIRHISYKSILIPLLASLPSFSLFKKYMLIFGRFWSLLLHEGLL